MENEIDPEAILNLFKEDIKTDSIHERLFTAGNMWLVAAALGPDYTRNELIPFLSQDNHFDGEVKAIIAEQLGNFVKYVGGAQNASILLAPLKMLADSEEMFVRDKAIQSIAAICSLVPPSNCDQVISGLLNELFNMNPAQQSGTQCVTSRIAACALVPMLYDRVNDQNKAKLRRSFFACVKDEAPIVRRAAIHAIPALCNVLKQSIILNEVLRQALNDRVNNDDDESIRVMIPECLPAIAAKIGNNERYSVLVPIARQLVKDTSWWVRANMAKNLPVLVPYFAADLLGSDIGAILLFLLRDLDPEVKTAACGCCKQIVDVLVKVQSFFNDSVLPEIAQLSVEKFKQVREEVAADILVFARISGETVAKEKIFPILAALIDDKERDVVIAALKSLRANFETIDSYAVTQVVLPKLIEIATKEDWRVKVEIIRLLCLFVPFITAEAIPSQIIPLINNWLQDSVFTVREEICKVLPNFIQLTDSDSVREEVISLLTRLNYSTTYLIREAALFAIWYLADVLAPDVISEKLLPSVLIMASDQIPNVRILAAKTLVRLKSYVDKRGIGKINLCLKLLANDDDSDVKFFASR